MGDRLDSVEVQLDDLDDQTPTAPKMRPFNRVRIVYDGDPVATRVELVSFDDRGGELVHDIPVESFSLLATCDGSKLVLVLPGGGSFEVHATGDVAEHDLAALREASERLNNWRSGRSREHVIERLAREVENAEANAEAGRRELAEKFGIVLSRKSTRERTEVPAPAERHRCGRCSAAGEPAKLQWCEWAGSRWVLCFDCRVECHVELAG